MEVTWLVNEQFRHLPMEVVELKKVVHSSWTENGTKCVDFHKARYFMKQMRKKWPFPAVSVRQTQTGYEVDDGNHRYLASVMLGATKIAVHVVNAV